MERRLLTGAPVALTLMFLTPVLLPFAQRGIAAGFWRGELEIRRFNFSYAVGVRNGNRVVRSVGVWKRNYDLYQNPGGVVREVLTSINRNRSVEGPMDVRLFNYLDGKGLVFDKGRSQAVEGPILPPVPGRTLGKRFILGFSCEGSDYEWKTPQHATVELQSWTANNSSFKVPLLQVEYFTDGVGALIAMTVRVVSRVEPSAELPASLFQPPAGLRVVHVPMVQ